MSGRMRFGGSGGLVEGKHFFSKFGIGRVGIRESHHHDATGEIILKIDSLGESTTHDGDEDGTTASGCRCSGGTGVPFQEIVCVTSVVGFDKDSFVGRG